MPCSLRQCESNYFVPFSQPTSIDTLLLQRPSSSLLHQMSTKGKVVVYTSRHRGVIFNAFKLVFKPHLILAAKFLINLHVKNVVGWVVSWGFCSRTNKTFG